MNLYKRYVDVILEQKKSGEVIPLYICWENGCNYRIEKILSKGRSLSSLGGGGMKYTCLIHGELRTLFLEKNRWFVESRNP